MIPAQTQYEILLLTALRHFEKAEIELKDLMEKNKLIKSKLYNEEKE